MLKDKLKIVVRSILTKSFLFRFIGRILVIKNQKNIIKQSKSSKFIFLNPVRPPMGRGGIVNYYHFIFDLVMPLNILIKNSPSDVVFILNKRGNFTDTLNTLFPDRIKIENNFNSVNVKKMNLIGMNPKWVHISKQSAENFKSDICNKLGIIQSANSKKIILIERAYHDSALTSNKVSSRGGSLRRSIVNHNDLSSALMSMVKAPYEFYNLKMEYLSFSEQIYYFDRAVIMIAQHGAALANCLWMKPGSIVIELSSFESRDHALNISRLRKHNYYLYKTTGKHVEIDINDFENWILNNSNLRKYFHTSGNNKG